MTPINVGIVPLTDCAPIVAARELGLFSEAGLDVTLSREPSWAGLRDKLAFGILDAAQMLSPMVPAMRLGLTGSGPSDVTTALGLGTGGNAITLSVSLADEVGPLPHDGPTDAATLRPAIDRRVADGREPLTFGVVFAHSLHHYQLRTWLEAGGINVDEEVRLRVVPPPQVADRLELGALDGFCVGEPWNTVSVRRGVGRTVAAGVEVLGDLPEKVLAVHDLSDPTHAALADAVHVACHWCADAANHDTLIGWLADPNHVGTTSDDLHPALSNQLAVTEHTTRTVADFYRPDHANRLTDTHLTQLLKLIGASTGDTAGMCRADLLTHSADPTVVGQ